MQDKSPMLQHALHLFKYGNMSMINFSWLLIGYLTSCLEYTLHVGGCVSSSPIQSTDTKLGTSCSVRRKQGHKRVS